LLLFLAQFSLKMIFQHLSMSAKNQATALRNMPLLTSHQNKPSFSKNKDAAK
jgi:hypothetical protein